MWMIALDLVVAIVSLASASLLRFGHFPEVINNAFHPFWIVVAIQTGAIAIARSYARSVNTAARIRRFFFGAVAGSLAAGGVLRATYGPPSVSISMLAADTLILILGGVLWRSANTLWALTRRNSSLGGEPPSGMYAIGGPKSPLLSFSELSQYRGLVNSLVARDLKLKYRGSTLGFLWSLVNPLVMVGVYTVVFTYFFRQTQPGFVARLLLGLLAWSLFANSALMSTGAVVDSGGLIKNVYFPRTILPVSTVLFNLAMYLLTLMVLLPVMFAINGIAPAASMLAFPVFLTLHVAFCIGVAFALASTTVMYRDIRHLTEIALAILFWMTPIIYSMGDIPAWLRLTVLLNPMSSFVLAYQEMFYARQWPDAHIWMLATLYSVSALMIGAALFASFEERFGEQI